MIGQRLLHYEILEKLGEGGMGVVYKARDHHLDRFVALKLLRSDKTIDDDRRRRFVQEAKAASALNHPNIVTIYDIGTDNGADFIAMEFIAGRTLDSVITRQGMRLEELLRLSIPVADALSKAHGAGILHRDLKPSNIMIDGDGRPKLLDFGLAKLTDRPEKTEREATLTQVAADTQEGSIVGTVAYMSPEQAEGKKLDVRSDIFSFGALLYEMATGHKAFNGDTAMSTLAAVINKDPKPVSDLSSVAPRDLDRIIARCLRKDPERRPQTMRDVRNALEDLKEDSESGRLTPIRAAESKAGRPGRAWWIPTAAGVLVAAAAAWWFASRTPPQSPVLQLRQLTSGSGLTMAPAISPDGRLVAYASDRAGQKDLDIWVQPLTKGAEPIRLTQNPADDTSPAFSPDGGLIAFNSRRDGGGVYIVPALGGQERLLVRGGSGPRFSPDGSWIAYTTTTASILGESKIYLLPVTGGTPRQLAADVPWAIAPVFSPDGKHVLFAGAPSSNALESIEWWVAPIDGGKSVRTGILEALKKQGIQGTGALGWIGNRILFGSGGHVWDIEISLRDWTPAGAARQLTSGAGPFTQPSATLSGELRRMVVFVGSRSTRLFSLKLDPNTGKASPDIEPLFFSGGDQYGPTGSAEGRKLVYIQSDPNTNSVRLRDMETGRETNIISANVRPVISPDGSMIACSDRTQLSMIRASGGEATNLLKYQGAGQVLGWSPDSRKIVYWDGNPIRFSLFDIQSRQKSELVSHPKYDIHGASLSPDQQWVLFHTPLDRKAIVRIAPVRNGKAAGEEEWITVVDRNANNRVPFWSPDGRLIYFLSNLDGSSCLYAQKLDASKHPIGDPFPVHHFHQARIQTPAGIFMGLALTPNRLIFALSEISGNVWIAEGRE